MIFDEFSWFLCFFWFLTIFDDFLHILWLTEEIRYYFFIKKCKNHEKCEKIMKIMKIYENYESVKFETWFHKIMKMNVSNMKMLNFCIFSIKKWSKFVSKIVEKCKNREKCQKHELVPVYREKTVFFDPFLTPQKGPRRVKWGQKKGHFCGF